MANFKQLTLDITPRIAYCPDSFFLHSGVKGLFDDLTHVLRADSFVLALVRGAPRTGKTHLSLALSDNLFRGGLFPRLVEGESFAQWIATRMEHPPILADEVILVDDAERYLRTISQGESGPFVNLVESARVTKAKIVLFLPEIITDFNFDEHVESRMLSGMEMALENPAPDELERVLDAIAKQRGMQLSPKKKGFVTKRVGRSIESIESYLDKVARLAHDKGQSVNLSLLGEAL